MMRSRHKEAQQIAPLIFPALSSKSLSSIDTPNHYRMDKPHISNRPESLIIGSCDGNQFHLSNLLKFKTFPAIPSDSNTQLTPISAHHSDSRCAQSAGSKEVCLRST